MLFEDLELVVSVGQPDSEYPLGVGGTTDDTPTIGMHATQPKTQRGSREACKFLLPESYQFNPPTLMVSNTYKPCMYI